MIESVGVVRDGMKGSKRKNGQDGKRGDRDERTDLGLVAMRWVFPLETNPSPTPSPAGQNKEKPPPVPNPDYEVTRDRVGGAF